MISFNGMKIGKNAERKSTQRESIPVGGYIAKILKAEVIEYSWGDVLSVSFDIDKGEYRGHYKKDWDAQEGGTYTQKWGGNIRINVPSEKSRYYDSDVTKFNNFIADIQDSNGIEWDGNEARLKGNLIGVLIREESGTLDDGNEWIKNRPSMFICTGDVEDGNFKMPKPYRSKKNKAVNNTITNPMFEDVDDDDLPF